MKLKPKKFSHIQQIQELIARYNCENDLNYIQNTFSSMVKIIKMLESKDIEIFHSIQLIDDLVNDLKNSPGLPAKTALDQLENTLLKNSAFRRFKQIISYLNDRNSDLPLALTDQEIQAFRFAPVTNAEVERSFSRYRWIFNDYRCSLTEQNLKFLLVVNYNN